MKSELKKASILVLKMVTLENMYSKKSDFVNPVREYSFKGQLAKSASVSENADELLNEYLNTENAVFASC